MHVHEYQQYDATGLAALIRGGQVSREEVLEAALVVIEQANPALQAVVRMRVEQARRESQQVESSACFAGVPTLSKDLLMALEGEPLAFGSAALRDWRPAEDSLFIQRSRRAGLVVVGQTATPELGLMGITEPGHLPTLKTHGAQAIRPVVPAVGRRPRWPGAWCPWRWQAMAAVPFVSLPAIAGCSGSSLPGPCATGASPW